MNRELRNKWAAAYDKVATEYAAEEHTCSVTTCPKCIIATNTKTGVVNCNNCLEIVFAKLPLGLLQTPCNDDRLINASNSYSVHGKHKDALVEYNSKVAKYLISDIPYDIQNIKDIHDNIFKARISYTSIIKSRIWWDDLPFEVKFNKTIKYNEWIEGDKTRHPDTLTETEIRVIYKLDNTTNTSSL